MSIRDAASELRGRSGEISRQTRLVIGMSATQLALACIIGRPLLHTSAPNQAVGLPWWALAVGFVAADAALSYVQVEREAMAIPAHEMPLVLGLFFASPAQLCLGWVAAECVNVLVLRRPALKSIFNISSIALMSTTAAGVFHALRADGDPSSPSAWLGTYAAVVAEDCVSAVAVTLVIAASVHGFRARDFLRKSLPDARPIAVATAALVAATSLAASSRNTWLLLLAGAVLLMTYRGHSRLRHRFADLERLHRFAQVASTWPAHDESLDDVLAEARALLQAERAEVILVSPSSAEVTRVRLSGDDGGRPRHSSGGLDPRAEWLLSCMVDPAEPLLLSRSHRDERRWLDAEGLREVLAVPLRGDAGVFGALLVADRLGDLRTFHPDDARLLETVADHAVAALRTAELVQELRHEALHDALTGLPNRAHLQRQMGSAFAELAVGRSSGVAAMILDLDGFKQVNDTLGHQHGDLLLVEIAARLSAAVATDGLVARLGGDEFAILLTDAHDDDCVRTLGRRVLRSLEPPVTLAGTAASVGGSLGAALAPRDAHDAAGLLKCADIAMYGAKTSGGGLRFYADDVRVALELAARP
jgi:diguanylate cyclase (GGDEF)-like protein